MAVDYSKIITDICKDILKLTDMFPYFIIAAVLITCFIYTIFRWHKKLKFVLWCLFIFYIEALLWITFFSREPGSRRAIDMTFLYTWGYTAQEHAFFIENIILFVPFGFMMPCIFRMFRKMPVCVMGGFIFSVMIEVVQYITQRGYSQLDDVVTNTLDCVGFDCRNYIYDKKSNKNIDGEYVQRTFAQKFQKILGTFYLIGLVKLALIYVLNMAEVHKNQNNFDIFSRFY